MEQVSPSPSTIWTPRRVAATTLVVLGIAAAFLVLIEFRLVFMSLFIAIVLSTAVNPLIVRLGRLGISRPVSMLLISLIILFAVIGLAEAVAPLVSQQWATITRLLSNTYSDLHLSLQQSSSLLVQRVARQMPFFLPTQVSSGSTSAPPTADAMQEAILIGGSVLHSLVLGISILLLTGLWILEGEVAQRFLLLSLPQNMREPTRLFLADSEEKIGAYTRGLAILSFIVGALAGVAYLVVGLPNVLLLGIFAGLMEIVPLIGPALGAIPAVLVAASTSPEKVVLVIGIYVLIQFAENHFIVPRVMDRAVGVNPVASLLAFLAFGAIFGFFGALLAVPLAALIQLVLNRFLFRGEAGEPAPPSGRDLISALRYETQDLMSDLRKQVRDKDAEAGGDADALEDDMETIATDLDSILAQMEPDRTKTNATGKPSV